MITAALLIFSYGVGMIPNQFLYQKIVPRKKLEYVRSDFISALDVLKHFKEPAFFLTVGTDFLKGIGLALLGIYFSESGVLSLIMILVAICARNFNVFIGIRNGHGMAILLGGLMIYEPIILIPMILFTIIFGFVANDLDMAFLLSVAVLPVALTFFSDPIGAMIVSSLIMVIMITHQQMYTKEAARRTHYDDTRRNNPYE